MQCRPAVLSARARGVALASVMSVVVVLLTIGMGLLAVALYGRKFSIRTTDQIAARVAADAGLQRALFEINQRFQAGSFDDGSLGAGRTSLPGCDASFDYTLGKDEDGDYTLTATGYSGRAARTTSAKLRLQGPFDAALLVRGPLVMKPSSVVDGYNYEGADDTLTVGTFSTLANQITLGDRAVINGDVAVGVGGDPERVICANGATITGRTYAMVEEAYWPAVTVPQWLATLPSGGTLNSETMLTAAAKYDAINLSQGKIIKIDGPVTLFVTGDISLSNSAQLQVSDTNPQASLTLFLGGNFYSKNGGAINNLTKDSTRLKIFGLDTCTNISLGAAGTFYGAIFAPEAMVNLKSSVEIHGSVLANAFNQGSTANFYYDAALRKVGINDYFVRFVIDRWQEN